MGFGFSIFFPLTLEIILSKTRKGISGKIIGAYETVFGIGWAIGPTIGGPITQSFGDETPYFIFCIIGIGVTIALAIISRKKLEPQKIELDIHGSTFLVQISSASSDICNKDFSITFSTSTSSICNCI